MDNKKILKVGKFTLNESLSQSLYKKMNKWHRRTFGKRITFEECQKLLFEFDYTIDWAVDTNEKHGCTHTFFFVTISNKEILTTKLKGIKYCAFDLDVMLSAVPSPNDFCLKNILETDNMRN